MHSFGLGVLLILLSAFGFGLMPIFAAYAYAGGVNVPTLLFLRFSLAAICFFSYLSWRGAALRLRRRELLPLLFLGSSCTRCSRRSIFRQSDTSRLHWPP